MLLSNKEVWEIIAETVVEANKLSNLERLGIHANQSITLAVGATEFSGVYAGTGVDSNQNIQYRFVTFDGQEIRTYPIDIRREGDTLIATSIELKSR